jgi:hypothetical protein
MKLLFLAFSFFSSFAFASCPAGYYPDGFGGCGNHDCPPDQTRASYTDSCQLIPPTPPTCNAPQVYDSLSNSCITLPNCPGNQAYDSVTNLCKWVDVPTCTGSTPIYDTITNTCMTQAQANYPTCTGSQIPSIDNCAPVETTNAFSSIVNNTAETANLLSLIKNHLFSDSSQSLLGQINQGVESFRQQSHTDLTGLLNGFSTLAQHADFTRANQTLDSIAGYLLGFKNDGIKTNPPTHAAGEQACDPYALSGQFGVLGLPACADYEGHAPTPGNIDNSTTNNYYNQGQGGGQSPDYSNQLLGIDQHLSSLFDDAETLNHFIKDVPQTCTPVLDADGNPVLDKKGFPLQNCSGGVKVPGTFTAGTFDLATQQAALVTAKTEFQTAFNSVKTDVTGLVSFGSMSAGSFEPIHIMDIYGHSIDTNSTYLLQFFTYIGGIIYFLALYRSVEIILG